MSGPGVVETTELIEPWLFGRMWADTAMRAAVGDNIYGPLSSVQMPNLYVSTAMLSTVPFRGIGQRRWGVNCLYLVKAVMEGTTQDVGLAAAKRISALFDEFDGNVTNPNGVQGHITCTYDRTISYSEVERNRTFSGGQPFLHLGSEFRIIAYT